MEDRQKKVVDGSNEGLMKDFFAQLIAGRERWIVPGKTFCESFHSLVAWLRSLGAICIFFLTQNFLYLRCIYL